MQLSETLLPVVEDGSISDEVDHAKNEVTLRLGVPFPGVSISVSDQVPADHYIILVNEIPAASGSALRDQIFTMAPQRQIEAAGVSERDCRPADNGAAGTWLPVASGPALEGAGIRYIDPVTLIGQSLSGVLRKNAAEFIGMQETKHLLNEAEKAFPDLVAEANRAVPIARLTEVLKRLVDEGVAIRNMRTILEAVIEWAPKEKDGVMLTECTRSALSRQISYQYGGAGQRINALTFSAELEETIRQAINVTPGGNFLGLAPDVADRLTTNIDQAFIAAQKSNPANSSQPVVLVSMDIRRYARQLIEGRRPELAVLSYQNLTPEIRVTSVGVVQAADTGEQQS